MTAERYRQKLKTEYQTVTFWRDVFAEFLATFILLLAQCSLPLSWGKPSHELGNAVQTGLGMGFVVLTMAWALGDFGGAHMNPAVTLSMVVQAKITWLRGLAYLVVQCAGATSGAAYIAFSTPKDKREGLAATRLHPDVEPWQGVLIEAWITAVLVLTILGSTNVRRKGSTFMHTVPIGLAVALGPLSAFVSTGASMNPARSLGPAVVMSIWDDHWVYWVGPLTGSLVATGLYVICLDRIDRPPDTSKTQNDSKPGLLPKASD